MDYAIEYALMSELYDERCLNYLPATEGIAWDKIKGFFKRIWDWIVKKVGDLIAKLKKKPSPSSGSHGPLLLTTSKNSAYAGTVGRDANGNPYTRVMADRSHAEEKIEGVTDRYRGKGKLYEFAKQTNQMALHVNRLVNNCFAIVYAIEKYVINSRSNSNIRDFVISYDQQIEHIDKNSEDLDAYIVGLNEIKAECIEEGLQIQMHDAIVYMEIKESMARNLGEFKQHAERMSMYMNKIDSYVGVKISGNFNKNDNSTKLEFDSADIIRKASEHIQSSLVIIEKAVAAVNSL